MRNIQKNCGEHPIKPKWKQSKLYYNTRKVEVSSIIASGSKVEQHHDDGRSLLEQEIIDMTSIITELKLKLMNSNETVLNLEIENLKSIIEYKDKENSLLQKENQSLSAQIRKFETTIRNTIEETKHYRDQVNKQVYI